MKKQVLQFGVSLALTSSLLGAVLVAPAILNPTIVRAADDTQTAVPNTVNIKIHKLMYDKKAGSTLDTDKNGTIDPDKGEGLVNDGHEKSSTGDLTAWDKSQYGNVGFTLYDITEVVGDITKLTEAKINAIIADVEKNGANSTYIKNAESNPTSQLADANGVVSFGAIQKCQGRGGAKLSGIANQI